MSGYFSERLSTGIKDPLLAKAVVFEQGQQRAALVFCDLIGVPRDLSTRARQRASGVTGIPVSHIAVAATHTHTGPLYFGALREHSHQRAVVRIGRDPHEPIDYAAELVGKIAQAVKQAQESLAPITLAGGYAIEKRLSFNRRFHMKDGSVRFNPGQLNPNIVRPAGPIDPQVGLVRIDRTDDDRPVAAIVNFALHLDTTGGTLYSADYPKYLQDQLRQVFGPGFVSLFGTGTCGDINHVDVSRRGRRGAQEIGTMLGRTVAARLGQLPAVQPSLAVRSVVVNVPMQQYGAERVAEARKKMALVDSRKLGFLERVEAYKIMALQLRGGRVLPLEVQAFRLAPDLAIVTLPGEVFVDLGLAIKRASPFSTTLVIELVNDAPGYIPTKKAFAEGSYETVNSRIEPGGGEQMVAAALQLLRQL